MAGFNFPGRTGFYLSSTLSGLFKEDSNQLIYNQKAGARIFSKVWIEGNMSLGNMTNYNDYDGMYVYNSIDPMISRTGATLFLYLRKITLWASYSIEQRQYYENTKFHYNQFSYLGGVKWKL